MLYTTSRSNADTYTAHRTLMSDRTPDGGFYIPFRLPSYNEEEISQIADMRFGDAVARILNVFFSVGLTGWDVEWCIGKKPVRLHSVGHRVVLCDLWNNPRGSYRYLEQALCKKIMGTEEIHVISDWTGIAIRIAILFGAYTLLKKEGIPAFDVTVNSGDFSAPMAVYYAKKMGLPVGKVICACNDNDACWELIQRGTLNTARTPIETATPHLDVSLPGGLERLICETMGHDAVHQYLGVCEKMGIFRIPGELSGIWNKDLFSYVVGNDRLVPLMSRIFRSHGLVLDPYTAVSYGALQDHRAKYGEGNVTVMLWEDSPVRFLDLVSRATGLLSHEINAYINRI